MENSVPAFKLVLDSDIRRLTKIPESLSQLREYAKSLFPHLSTFGLEFTGLNGDFITSLNDESDFTKLKSENLKVYKIQIVPKLQRRLPSQKSLAEEKAPVEKSAEQIEARSSISKDEVSEVRSDQTISITKKKMSPSDKKKQIEEKPLTQEEKLDLSCRRTLLMSSYVKLENEIRVLKYKSFELKVKIKEKAETDEVAELLGERDEIKALKRFKREELYKITLEVRKIDKKLREKKVEKSKAVSKRKEIEKADKKEKQNNMKKEDMYNQEKEAEKIVDIDGLTKKLAEIVQAETRSVVAGFIPEISKKIMQKVKSQFLTTLKKELAVKKPARKVPNIIQN
eukprot:TRINITY_DN13254_c0_g1_i4.p1 TRINITY_DN13254_c0_g1~~TRINITY_DN13254_c0_g1_i4.p1  ORF type:complete len:341 (-),score=99.36 TRINITY_DN13254_c0_g1_i4:122-1144(-)